LYQTYRLTAAPAIDQPREQHRVHFSGVVSPGDAHITLVQIVVTTGGLVDPVRAHEAGHGRRHAEACIGIDLIVGQHTFRQLLRGVTFGGRPLAATIDGKAHWVAHGTLGDDVDGFFPTYRAQRAPLPQQRLGDAVFAVQR